MKIETLALSEVVPDPANVRVHDDHNLDAIRGSLARFGQQKPIVVDSSGMIRAGNGTYFAAKALGWETIKVVRTGLEGIEATAFAIADNRTSDLSEWDDPALAKLLDELRAEDAADGIGYTGEQIDELLAQVQALIGPGEVLAPEPEQPPLVAVSRLGDLWLLGRHRLLCADSSDPEAVGRLLAGALFPIPRVVDGQTHALAAQRPDIVQLEHRSPCFESWWRAGRLSREGAPFDSRVLRGTGAQQPRETGDCVACSA